MENKTNISALEELVNSEIRIYKKNCDKIDNDILEQNIWMTVESYYEDDRIPTKEELEYLDKLGFNFTEFAAHYEVVASALAVKEGHKINPDFKIGTMINYTPVYPATSAPEDVLLAQRVDQRRNWFSDVQVLALIQL